MGNFSNYWDLHTLFTKLKNKLKSISDKIDDSVSLKTATGNPIVLTDAANANSEELSMTIVPIQSGSGDPSSTNVRPISGLTEGKVTRTGKNLFNGQYSETGVFLLADGSTASGGTSWNISEYIPVKGDETYTISFDTANQSGAYVCCYDKNKTYISSFAFTTAKSLAIKTPSNASFLRTSVVRTAINFQIECGTTATEYEPYTGATATITLGQTVYGGEVDFKTGVVTVSHVSVSGTISSLYDLPHVPKYQTGDGRNKNLCDKLIYRYDLSADPHFFFENNHLITRGIDGSEVVQLCYELATPTTLTLTPAELELLKGNNTITANGAEISLSYYPDNAIGALAGRVDDVQEQIDSKVPLCKATVDLSSLDQDTYYPVTGTSLNGDTAKPQRICVNVALNSETKPSWSTHSRGFSVTLDVLIQGGGWGTQRSTSNILVDTSSHVSGNISPCAYTQMTSGSVPVIWCRGGGKYFIYTDYDSNWTVRTSTYTVADQSVSPTTTKPTNYMVSTNGYFGGISENAYHVMDSWSNTRGLNIRWAGPGYTTADYIPAFNTAGTEIGPLSLVTLGKLLNIVGNYSTSYTDFNNFPHGSIVQVYGSAAHAPGNALHYYVVFTYYIANTTTYKLQLAIENGSGNVYTRDCTNGTWEDWNLILKQDALETKYLHYISIQRYNESDNFPTYDVLIPIVNNTAATMTKTEILAYLDEHGHIKPLHGMYIYRTNGNITSAEPVVDFVYSYYEGSEDKQLIFYRFEHDEHTLTTDASNLRIEDRFVVQIVQNT